MENATTAIVIAAGIFFSLSCALLLEELLLGALFRLFIAPLPKRSQRKGNPGQKNYGGMS